MARQAVLPRNLPVGKELIDVYLIGRPDGRDIEQWAKVVHRGLRWTFGWRRLLLPRKKARMEFAVAMAFILTAGAGAFGALRNQGLSQDEAYQRVRDMLFDQPDNFRNKVWVEQLWRLCLEYERQQEANYARAGNTNHPG